MRRQKEKKEKQEYRSLNKKRFGRINTKLHTVVKSGKGSRMADSTEFAIFKQIFLILIFLAVSGSLLPQPGMEPGPLAVRAWTPNPCSGILIPEFAILKVKKKKNQNGQIVAISCYNIKLY